MKEIVRVAGRVAAQVETASRICLRSSFPKSCSRRLPRRVFASDRSTTVAAAESATAIRPFLVNVPETALVDLRQRVLATR